MYKSVQLSSGPFTVTGQTGQANVESYDLVTAYCNFTGFTGAGASITPTLLTSYDGIVWFTVATGTLANAAGQQTLTASTTFALGQYVAVSYVVAGTTPSITGTIEIVAR